MNLERIAAALRLLADALEDKAEAIVERTAIQAEPPIAPASTYWKLDNDGNYRRIDSPIVPAPTVNWTLDNDGNYRRIDSPIVPAPTVNWTLEQVRSALGTMTKLTSRQQVLDKVGNIHLASADQAELNRIMKALDMPEGASHE